VTNQDRSKTSWTVSELLVWTEKFFRGRGVPAPRLDAELLLSSVLGGGRMGLYTEYEKPVEPAERAQFRSLVERRATREPVAYLTGVKEFYSLRFTVSPAVLIPRPETEHLVDEGVAYLRTLEERETPPRVLDLGAGSGNISVALASQCPRAQVDAIDVSDDAIAIASGNATDNDVGERVRFLRGDLFDALPTDAGRYDLIVSNPPYVAGGEFDTLMDDVRCFEPRLALVDEKSPSKDGLGFYRAIAESVREHLADDGIVLVEVGDAQAVAVAAMFSEAGLSETRLVRDYAGINRVVRATSA
jgi:release factor glutamine methyltransferase